MFYLMTQSSACLFSQHTEAIVINKLISTPDFTKQFIKCLNNNNHHHKYL